MDYQGLTSDDLVNIDALNRWFLRAISDSDTDAFTLVSTQKLTLKERNHLAGAPFLLFSLREQEEEYWQQLLDATPQPDLLDSCIPRNQQIRQVQVAGLVFLWQLARRNPYAVRLVCGASVSWCERLSGLTLAGLMQQAAQRRDLLRLRFANDAIIWRRLLVNARALSHSARLASQYCSLQVMLIRRQTPNSNTLSAAACRIRGPGQHVTQLGATGIREPKV